MERDALKKLIQQKDNIRAFAKEILRFNLSLPENGIVHPEKIRELATRLKFLADSEMPIRKNDLVSTTLAIINGVQRVYSDLAEQYTNEVNNKVDTITSSRPSPIPEKAVLTEDETAKVLGWHKETLAKRRRTTPNQVPRFYRPGGDEGRVYYTRESIEEYLRKSLTINLHSA